MTVWDKPIKTRRIPILASVAAFPVQLLYPDTATNPGTTVSLNISRYIKFSPYDNKEMALNQSMEVYLSLITVLIMCIPGLAFLVQRCRNRQAKQTQMPELLPISEQRTWTAIYLDNTIFRVPTAPHHPCRPREDPHYASQTLASRSKPHIDSIELVGD